MKHLHLPEDSCYRGGRFSTVPPHRKGFRACEVSFCEISTTLPTKLLVEQGAQRGYRHTIAKATFVFMPSPLQSWANDSFCESGIGESYRLMP
jgi:hypothetical protein